MPISALPDDILRMIFKEVHNSVPASNRVSKTPFLVAAPTDPITVASAARVCRRWRRVERDCRELRTSIIAELPFIRRTKGLRCYSREHATTFLKNLADDTAAHVRVCLTARMQKLTPAQMTNNLNRLRPLIGRAETFVLHGYDPDLKRSVTCVSLQTLAPSLLRSFSCDHVSFRKPDGRESLVPFLEFLRACTNLRELRIFHIQAGELGQAVKPIHATLLENIEFAGPVLLLQELLRHIQIQPGVRVAICSSTDDPVEYGHSNDYWRTNKAINIKAQQQISPLVLQKADSGSIESSLEAFPHIRSLEMFGVTLDDSFFLTMPTSCPDVVTLSLVRCTFSGDALRHMYREHRKTSMLPENVLSSLSIKDCKIWGMTSEALQAQLRDIIFNLSWNDASLVKVTSRERLWEIPYEPEAEPELPQTLTPPFEDDEYLTDDDLNEGMVGW